MLNVRKLRQDFSSNILKEGKGLYDEKKVVIAKILHLDAKTVRISGKVLGQFNNTYTSELEIDRQECETIDSDCDCPYHYDCQHLAALLYYLEEHLDEILVNFSKENDLQQLSHSDALNHEDKQEILEAVKEAASKEEVRKEEQYQRQLLQEYVTASRILAKSPFFLPFEKIKEDQADLAVIFSFSNKQIKTAVEIQLAFRLPSRSKPLHIPNLKQLVECIRNQEGISIGGKKILFLFKFV